MDFTPLKFQENFIGSMLEIALAILIVNNHYVLQLRDDKPNIRAPGMWALFGGEVKKGEKPRLGIVREIKEELCLEPKRFLLFWACQRSAETGPLIHFSIFEADITDLWGQHKLMEGQAVKYFSYNELGNLDIPPFVREVLQKHYMKDHRLG